MAIVEDVTDAVHLPRSNGEPGPNSSSELLRTLRALSKRLALPEELLPSFLHEEKPTEALETYSDHALSLLRQMRPLFQFPAWSQSPLDDQAEVIMDVARLYGHDDWTTPQCRDLINDITASIDCSGIAVHLLTNNLRTLFQPTPHPMLNTSTSRALSRPAGGKDASSDLQDAPMKTYKAPHAWGSHNVLAWCANALTPDELERRIGLILPPTLILMDDYEPPWRGKGISVLSVWLEKLPAETMRRMGVDKLLLSSLLHTLNLHSSHLRGVVQVATRTIEYTTKGKEKADRYAELVDKGIIQGWIYAPSGKEGRSVLIGIAQDLEKLCDTLGVSIVRWLKAIIPNLLNPLQYSPTQSVFLHYKANLSALLRVMTTIRETGRLSRWRGQILDMLSRLWVQLGERGADDLSETDGMVKEIKELLVRIFAELEEQCPEIRDNEIKDLMKLDKTRFQNLVPRAA